MALSPFLFVTFARLDRININKPDHPIRPTLLPFATFGDNFRVAHRQTILMRRLAMSL
jgi:hypothetical protein